MLLPIDVKVTVAPNKTPMATVNKVCVYSHYGIYLLNAFERSLKLLKTAIEVM
jgi:hypothetical protein